MTDIKTWSNQALSAALFNATLDEDFELASEIEAVLDERYSGSPKGPDTSGAVRFRDGVSTVDYIKKQSE